MPNPAQDTSVPVEIERSKFANETYKFLMGRQSRRRYGDHKQVEVTSHISIADALNASTNRVIEAEYAVLDDPSSSEQDVRLLVSSIDPDDDNEDDDKDDDNDDDNDDDDDDNDDDNDDDDSDDDDDDDDNDDDNDDDDDE